MKRIKKLLPVSIIIICVIIPQIYFFYTYKSDFHEICPGAAFCAAPLCIEKGIFFFETGIIIFAVTLLLTIPFRRFFCGWLCPVGLFQDLVFNIRRKIGKHHKLLPDKIHKSLLFSKYIIVSAVLVLIFYTGNMIMVDYCPVYLIASFGSVPIALPAVFLLGLIILAGIFIQRSFCRYLCPLSVFFEVILYAADKLKITRKINCDRETCISCGICEKNCPMAIRITSEKKSLCVNCIACYKCMKICPQNKKNKKALYIGNK